MRFPLRTSLLLTTTFAAITVLGAGCGDDPETSSATSSSSATSTSSDATTTTTATTTTSSGMGGAGGDTSSTTATGMGGDGGMGTGGSGGAGGAGGAGTGGAGGAGGAGGMTGTGGAGGAGTGGAGGAGTGGGGGQGPVASQGVYFLGDYTTNNVDQIGWVDYPGSVTPVTLARMGLTEARAIGVSPDGMTIAVAGEDMNAVSSFGLYAPDGSGTPVALFDPALFTNGSAASIDQIAYSPDGMWIAFRADLTLSGATELYVVPSDASAGPKRISQAMLTNSNDAQVYRWAPDSAHIAFVADPLVNGANDAYVVDVTVAVPAPVPLVPEVSVTSTQNINATTIAWGADGKVYFRGDYVTDTLFQLYRADMDGQNLEQVPGTALTNGNGESSIGGWGISDDRSMLAFSADAPSVGLYQVYVMDVGTMTPTQVSNVTTVMPATGDRGPNFFETIQVSPDKTMLAVSADWDVGGVDSDNDYAAFILPTGAMGGVRVVKPSTALNNQDVGTIGFSADGARLFIVGDLVVNNDTSFYSTTDFATADQDPATLLVQGVVTSGDMTGFVRVP